MKNIFIILLLFFWVDSHAQIFLPALISDHMVLQQKKAVNLWGKGIPNKNISIYTSWDKKKYKVAVSSDSTWILSINTPKAGGPYFIEFTEGKHQLKIEDILIGEVWLCSGQSNMEMPLKGFFGQPVQNSQDVILAAKSTQPIRLLTLPQIYSKSPLDTISAQWQLNVPENVADFSAVAYFFGQLLQKQLNVPIGLIDASWSASKIETWIDRKMIEEFVPEIDFLDVDTVPEKSINYPHGRGGLVYNGMINPILNMTIKGVVWYQGEANIENPTLYEKLFSLWINNWRKEFRDPEMPFYYTQLVPFEYKGLGPTILPEFQQMQLKLMDTISNIGMAFTTDLGEAEFIHPSKKKEIGERLGHWALSQTYGVKAIICKGPVASKYEKNGNRILISFDNATNGLMPHYETIIGFELLDKDGHLCPVEGRIKQWTSSVEIQDDRLIDASQIRYGFRNYIETNLKNTAGLPASPFCIDLKK